MSNLIAGLRSLFGIRGLLFPFPNEVAMSAQGALDAMATIFGTVAALRSKQLRIGSMNMLNFELFDIVSSTSFHFLIPANFRWLFRKHFFHVLNFQKTF